MDGTIFRIILLQSTTIVIVKILAIAQLKNWLRIIRWEDMYHSRSKFKWIFNICIYIYTQTITDTYVYYIFIKFQFKNGDVKLYARWLLHEQPLKLVQSKEFQQDHKHKAI